MAVKKKPQPKPATKVARHLHEYFGISLKESRKLGRETVKVLKK
jgi:NMD protein affecting ribosome stability and mRNA decay